MRLVLFLLFLLPVCVAGYQASCDTGANTCYYNCQDCVDKTLVSFVMQNLTLTRSINPNDELFLFLSQFSQRILNGTRDVVEVVCLDDPNDGKTTFCRRQCDVCGDRQVCQVMLSMLSVLGQTNPNVLPLMQSVDATCSAADSTSPQELNQANELKAQWFVILFALIHTLSTFYCGNWNRLNAHVDGVANGERGPIP